MSRTAGASPMTDAVDRLHRDGMRVGYHARETIIAERELIVARFDSETAREHWDAAVDRGHPVQAGKWAVRYHALLDIERAIAYRVRTARTMRDHARADFRDSARSVRQLAVIARRHHARHA